MDQIAPEPPQWKQRMRPLATHAVQLRSWATPEAVVGASYQLPRPPQLEQVTDPVAPHIEHGVREGEEEEEEAEGSAGALPAIG